MKRIPALLLALALILACLPVSAEGNILRFDKNVNVVFEGETLQTKLVRQGEPAGGQLSFTSSNANVATVDQNGVVTGRQKGQATITATVKTDKKTFRTQLTVTVARKVKSVEAKLDKLPVYNPDDPRIAGLLQPRENAEDNELKVIVIPAKKNFELNPQVLPKDATNRQVTVTSDRQSVLNVRNNGTINGAAPGDAIVTITSVQNPDVKARYRVLVVQPVTRITLNPAAKKVAAGDQVKISAQITPSNASVPGITWTSQDPAIATVDGNGVVTGRAKGNARIVASATDGSNVRANISITVTQKAEQVTLDKKEVTVDTGRSVALRATVLPKNTDNKKVVWSSSDSSVARVGQDGRITAVSLGECEIICTSAENSEAVARALVHVQQPVSKIVFGQAPAVYAGETAKLSWDVEPLNASNRDVAFSSNRPKVLTVDPDGTVHGVSVGEAEVKAVSLDGSNRTAKVKVKVMQHLTGVHMKRKVAYVSLKETAVAGAVFEPENASNRNMTWTVDDPSVATVKPAKDPGKVSITGVGYGETVVRGVTEDGGFETSIVVKVGDWDKALKLIGFDWDAKGNFSIRVRNNSDLTITKITAEIWVLDARPDADNAPVPINTKDGSHKVKVVWNKTLAPGQETSLKNPWKMVNYTMPMDINETRGTLYLISYEVDHDWIKTLRKPLQYKDW